MKNSKIYLFIYYSSVVLAIVYLFSNGLISFDKFKINSDFIVSIVFLVSGFIIYALSLYTVLKSQKVDTRFMICFTSLGSTIFSKYIPGKVAMIYAIAYKLKTGAKDISVAMLAYGTLLFQLLIIISGLIAGVFSVIQIGGISPSIKYLSIVFILSSLILVNSNKFFAIFSRTASKLLKKELVFSSVTKPYIIKILIVSLLFWLLWGSGLFFFIRSLGFELNDQSALIFLYPFSICIGIIAILSPGGIGVREGILAGFIISLGNSVSVAAEISVLSRMWFFLGEIFIFLISLMISYITKARKPAGEV